MLFVDDACVIPCCGRDIACVGKAGELLLDNELPVAARTSVGGTVVPWSS